MQLRAAASSATERRHGQPAVRTNPPSYWIAYVTNAAGERTLHYKFDCVIGPETAPERVVFVHTDQRMGMCLDQSCDVPSLRTMQHRSQTLASTRSHHCSSCRNVLIYAQAYSLEPSTEGTHYGD